ncbi:MAG: fumarylacetoacetate hydrolase family protein [Myxococcales bacterium]|nr:fumarylacetoacetate hydrolase family protein [Myxococcales bacterium]
MALSPETIEQLGDELFGALTDRRTVAPISRRYPDVSIDDAYQISRRLLSRRLDSGERLVGKKIGVTSKAVQDMLNVRQPDFGYLTDTMVYPDGGEMPIGDRLIQPRAECEIAFRLKSDLNGPGITNQDVLDATDAIMACFEIVDSRIEDWKIGIQDTIADNASSGLYVLGSDEVSPFDVDLVGCQMTVFKNGTELSRGTPETALTGQPQLITPLACVAWLANTLGRFGIGLKAGETILSGSLVPLEPVVPGDVMRCEIGGIGGASVRFV